LGRLQSRCNCTAAAKREVPNCLHLCCNLAEIAPLGQIVFKLAVGAVRHKSKQHQSASLSGFLAPSYWDSRSIATLGNMHLEYISSLGTLVTLNNLKTLHFQSFINGVILKKMLNNFL